MSSSPKSITPCVHDRLPVRPTKQRFEPWLTSSAGVEILQPAPNDLLRRSRESKRVNSARVDANDATLIEREELAHKIEVQNRDQ
jgi:putative SOS response-associated peptidase YedK